MQNNQGLTPVVKNLRLLLNRRGVVSSGRGGGGGRSLALGRIEAVGVDVLGFARELERDGAGGERPPRRSGGNERVLLLWR
jgi:hypothetical protein